MTFTIAMKEFLELCLTELNLEELPKIKWLITGGIEGEQPTFGRFDIKNKIISIEIKNRHPLDIMRTLAHELVHYKQLLNGQITDNSGETGSKIENQANAIAGIIMRHYNKSHPDVFLLKPL